MQFSKGILAIVAIVPLLAGLIGCANNILIGVHEGAERVTLAEANLSQVARNEAVDAGADTVVKGDSPEFGKRTFKLYKCQP